MAETIPERVHLVGSIGLDTVEEVFRTVGGRLGRRLKRVPDGEPGGRRLWISWQYPLLRANPFLRPDPAGSRRTTTTVPQLSLGDGVAAGDVRFGELGYAREARASYQDFVAARERGELPPGVKFQVCLPTPMAVIYAFITPPDVQSVEPAYERAMLAEVAALCRAIPHRDLSLQWDVCVEMVIWDGQDPERYRSEGASKPEILARLKRLAAAVPADVELGVHLCYGDFDGKHFFDPQDAAKMVELGNEIAGLGGHALAFLHMPVPMARSDDAFFRPFRELRLAPDTELYLGVVHAGDGVAGAKRRIAAASQYLGPFGIATECGMARARKPDTVLRLLDIHAEASHEPGRPA
jgi:hypothetical protein